MTMRLFKLFIIGQALLVATQAQAHLDGDHYHMSLLQGLLHFLSEPTHVVYLAGGIVLGGYILYILNRTLTRDRFS